MSTLAPTVTLRSGLAVPVLGLGTWPMDDAEVADAIVSAVDAGYRMIDTAENYGNEKGVGEGIRRSGIARDELVVVTKFNKKWHSVDGARQAAEASLERLGLDHLDVLLIHWPNPDQGTYVEAFEGLLALQEKGLVTAVGTSNFKAHHLADLEQHGYVPELNQIQLDPHTLRSDVLPTHERLGIVTEAWRPFGDDGDCAKDPVVVELASTYGRTPHQIVLRWHVQRGYVTCPKSADPQRQAQNLDVFSFELTDDEIARMSNDTPDERQLDADTFGH